MRSRPLALQRFKVPGLCSLIGRGLVRLHGGDHAERVGEILLRPALGMRHGLRVFQHRIVRIELDVDAFGGLEAFRQRKLIGFRRRGQRQLAGILGGLEGGEFVEMLAQVGALDFLLVGIEEIFRHPVRAVATRRGRCSRGRGCRR